MNRRAVSTVALAFAVFSSACQGSPRLLAPRSERLQPSDAPSLTAFHYDEWTVPVNLGAPINSSATEQNPNLSDDELTLYFSSSRPGGVGERDLYVAHRSSRESPWETPVNLGPTINSAAADISPEISPDGRLLFFASSRPGGSGQADIWVSHRDDPTDDFGWSTPVNLGPKLNTSDVETAPSSVEREDDGSAKLYFSRGVQTAARSDIYVVAVSRSGEVLGSPTVIRELSVDGFNDAAPSVRRDEREIFFWSTRPGSLGQDIWTSMRRNVHDEWSAPVRLAEPINSAANDLTPMLSRDGRTLLFMSDRPGGLGGADIWMSTRKPGGGM